MRDGSHRADAPLPAPVPLVVQLPEVAGVEPPHALTIFEDPAGSGPGGALWDAAVVLAHHLHSLTLRGAHVLELGAGTGLPGLAAARLGAHATLTDRPRALPLLRRNAEHNKLTVTVLELEWGCSPPEWSEAQAPPFQLVLGADVVCHDESMEPLIATLRQLLRGGGEALICNKCRDTAEHRFWHSAAEHFHVELLQEGLPAVPRDGDDLPVMLYRLWAR